MIKQIVKERTLWRHRKGKSPVLQRLAESQEIQHNWPSMLWRRLGRDNISFIERHFQRRVSTTVNYASGPSLWSSGGPGVLKFPRVWRKKVPALLQSLQGQMIQVCEYEGIKGCKAELNYLWLFLVHLKAILLPSPMSDLTSYDYQNFKNVFLASHQSKC